MISVCRGNKGDALITFLKVDSVAVACCKCDGLDIGDGYILRVAKADFSYKQPALPAACQAER